MINQVLPRSCRDNCVKRVKNCAAARRGTPRFDAFTLIELILVVGIIIVLAGLVLSTVGYARKKSAVARAETEIAALSAAVENYKADTGIYPYNNDTNGLDPRTRGDPNDTADPTYSNASVWLYVQLSGDSARNRNPTGKSYMQFKPNMLLPVGGIGTVAAIADPFGNSYGYSTAANPQANPTPAGTPGYNPTFDLWSTASGTTTADAPKWIKNW
jgi:type II secretory pathway pseudopilin PulG